MSGYRELAPPPPLADTVECFWIFQQDPSLSASHRVVPDGCADVIYTRADAFTSLQFIAPMTRYQDFLQTAGSCSIGVCFRPAMWAEMLRLNGRTLADENLPFEDLWGPAPANCNADWIRAHIPRQSHKSWHIVCLPAQQDRRSRKPFRHWSNLADDSRWTMQPRPPD